MEKLYYTKFKPGYKYRTHGILTYQTSITGYNIVTDYATLTEDGVMTIMDKYAYDGPSGPTFDVNYLNWKSPRASMRGACKHDVFYQLLREGALPPEVKAATDKEFYNDLIEDGMWEWRAAGWYKAVDNFADFAAKPKKKEKIYCAP